jgi:SAM-dependent methyltransferase
MRRILRKLAAPVLDRLDARMAHHVRVQLDARDREVIDPSPTQIADAPTSPSPTHRPFVPPIERVRTSSTRPFMPYSTCSTADFLHPRFAELSESCARRPQFHRKLWEHVFIVHHLTERGMLAAGRRGLGFGVGSEPLPAVFAAAGATIVATDAPAETALRDGWQATNQFALGAETLSNPGICDAGTFHDLVSYRTVDMNAVPDDLGGFDFCWSACCFEHLGSLRHGAEFVIESVERCLAPGGVAVHTTEFNLSSNTETLESPGLSIYRHDDLAELVAELEQRGHTVAPLTIAPDAHVLDHFVDLPPYHGDLHLKLELAGYATTSVGLVITKADERA